jgi:hypothetical protein
MRLGQRFGVQVNSLSMLRGLPGAVGGLLKALPCCRGSSHTITPELAPPVGCLRQSYGRRFSGCQRFEPRRIYRVFAQHGGGDHDAAAVKAVYEYTGFCCGADRKIL